MNYGDFLGAQLASVPSDWLTVHGPPVFGEGPPVRSLCESALASPVGSPPLAELAERARRIVIVVSDVTRDEPRDEMLDALLPQLPRERITLVVAVGTHRPKAVTLAARHAELPSVLQDGGDVTHFRDLGITQRGTRVRLLTELAEAQLVIATGRLRPHYFAGYSGGMKAIFPGCAYAPDILKNHLLKAAPGSRLSVVEGNPCRADMEEAALMLPGRVVLLNVLSDCDNQARAAVFGEPIAAHRALLPQARELFGVVAGESPVVVCGDRPPVTDSLYQASKMIAPAGALLSPGGIVIVVAACEDGIGPIQRVNEGIYRLGIAPQLPSGHEVWLVSKMANELAKEGYARPVATLRFALEQARARHGARPYPLLWRAGESIVVAKPAFGVP